MATKQAVKRKTTKRPSKTKSLSIKQWGSVYDKWIIGLCGAVLIALPLVFSRISYDQFDIIKLAIFRVLVVGIVLAWAAKIWVRSEPIIWSWREVLLASFLFLTVFSTLISIHIPTSLHGKYKRYEGLLTFITYITMYFIAMQAFKYKKQFRLMMEITSVVGGIVAFYGILQYVGWDPISWGAVPFELRRSFSTFGNPDLLAGYLVLAFPCAIAAYLGIAKRRWLHGFMVLFLGVDLFTAFTRSGWIGAFVASLCVVVLVGWKLLKARWREIAIIGSPMVIALIALSVYASSHGGLDITGKISGIFNFNSTAVIGRVEIWKAGLKMIEDRPLLGQGPGTFRLASEHFETKRYVRSVNGTTVSDNAHNYFIQLAAGVGPLAAVLMYVFFISWIIRAVGARRKLGDDDEGRILIAGAIAAVIGYLTTMVFGISIVGASSVFWLLMAGVAGYTRQVEPAYAARRISTWPQGLKLALTVGLIVLTTVSAGFAVAMYAGDIYFVEGLKTASINQFDLASANFDRAAALYPGNGRIMSQKGQMYQRLMGAARDAQDQEAFAQYSKEAVIAFQKASQAEPLEVDYQVFLANTYGNMGRVDNARMTLDIVLTRRPHSPPAHILYGQYEEVRGNNEEALKHYEAAMELAPDKPFPVIFSRMANLYKKAGHPKKAAFYAKKTALLKKPVNK